MWCDFEEFNHTLHSFNLKDDEVYLYAAFVDPAYRGQDLAPFMRHRCCQALKKCGKHTYYSYSDLFNRSAVRFKKKIGARRLKLRLYVSLGRRHSWNWVLRDYQKS